MYILYMYRYYSYFILNKITLMGHRPCIYGRPGGQTIVVFAQFLQLLLYSKCFATEFRSYPPLKVILYTTRRVFITLQCRFYERHRTHCIYIYIYIHNNGIYLYTTTRTHYIYDEHGE